jgi:hypothetical protein
LPAAAAQEHVETIARRVGRCQAELEGADDIAPAERREHLGRRGRLEDGAEAGEGESGRLRQVGPADHDHDVAGGELCGDLGVGQRGSDHGSGAARLVPDALPRGRRETRRLRRELEDAAPALLGRIAQPEVQHRQLLFQIGTEQHDGVGVGRLGDRGPIEPEDCGSDTVADLRVAPGDAERIGEPGPGERILVRATGTPQDGDRAGSTRVERLPEELGGDAHRRPPRRLDETRLTAHERCAEALLGVGGLER